MMKKRNVLIKTAALTLSIVCATAFAAVPAFAANLNQVSIVGLSGAVSAGDEVPPPRMFTEGLDLAGAEQLYANVNGVSYRVYLDNLRQRIYRTDSGATIVNGMYDILGGTYIRVTDYEADPMLTEPVDPSEVFGPAYTFPSDGNQYATEELGLPIDFPQLRGRGPHGGYTTTSVKCGTCHSAHSSPSLNPNALEGTGAGSVEAPDGALTNPNYLNVRGQRYLTRAGATGCEFCHLTGTPIGAAGMSSRVVYTGGMDGTSNTGSEPGESISGHSLFQGGIPIPNSEMVGAGGTTGPVTLNAGGLTCATCHAVHGNVGTWQPEEFFWGANGAEPGVFADGETVTSLSYRMLRANPAGVFNPAATPVAVAPAEPSDPLVAAVDTNQVNQFTMSEWCSNCHNASGMRERMDSMSMSSYGIEELLSMTTTFTAEYANAHSSGFALTYPGGESIPATAHPTFFSGVYSGPGQCYTCHRGDLGSSAMAQWEWTLNGASLSQWEPGAEFAPIPSTLEVVNQDLLDELAPFRDLGYFAVEPTATAEEQAYNLACSSCHFGTADYARWALMSDWPHRSADSDVMLLGIDLSDAEQTAVQANEGLPVDIASEHFCSRCHAGINDLTANMFMISHHYLDHSNVSNETTVGLGFQQSPGNEPTTTP
ncbi:MAG: hypothetical protein FWC86_01425 [Coriobacteriia bacterium]|nr:hypothetical protein [Coriobacteriia bacterium]